MALTEKDKTDIGQIVDEKITRAIETKVPPIVEAKISGVETKMTKEFGFLRLEMNQRFNETNQRIIHVEGTILDKIEEIKKMETEDIQALSENINMVKKKGRVLSS